jgi:hypothetical protein
MPYLQVKDCPQELYDAVKASAAASYRSMGQQVMFMLTQELGTSCEAGAPVRARVEPGGALPVRDERVARREKTFAALDAMATPVVPPGFPSITAIIREGREERDDRLGL